MTITSYAQNLEDVLLWRALKHVPNGFYVDVGASDPDIDSVTRLFYEHGWSGINIEPEQDCWRRLCQARPRDINVAIAVGDSKGTVPFYSIPVRGLSTLDSAVADAYRARGTNVFAQQIDVDTLSSVLGRYAMRPIHFLKIDVEGAERAVLKGLDLKVWRPWILVVEATKPNSTEQSHQLWEPIILSAGYVFVYFDGLNRYYVAEEQQGVQFAFEVPPNIFDDFVIDRMVSVGRVEERQAGVAEKAEIARQATKREADLVKAVRRYEALYTELEQLRTENGSLRASLDAVHASTSWRLTKPLRASAKALRVIKRPRASAFALLRRVAKALVQVVQAQAWLRPILRLIAKRFPGLWDWLMHRVRAAIATEAVVVPYLTEDAQMFKTALINRLKTEYKIAGEPS
ncbi:FkbM family methyltransferase [Cupriavidus sp. AcVe19-1a]|uniref:FkbM family methyltransferase n=1 Tax=Cupriavidus sp. AcVe19-1a TaxID=2821359 RepID=UPI001AE64413|nr:FkbM family methyltransferase [Cupriavidus sp. AcVe19-1a]MBP0628099.1 FkbM family methyltransferase [Cupriavidus sp. AcVe19-1a]